MDRRVRPGNDQLPDESRFAQRRLRRRWQVRRAAGARPEHVVRGRGDVAAGLHADARVAGGDHQRLSMSGLLAAACDCSEPRSDAGNRLDPAIWSGACSHASLRVARPDGAWQTRIRKWCSPSGRMLVCQGYRFGIRRGELGGSTQQKFQTAVCAGTLHRRNLAGRVHTQTNQATTGAYRESASMAMCP